ncbi:hypothetical protein B0H16DRAFT_367290 [Mycena metata]|uniref:Uncharacterized protein n=1 Tax=Mycena metata TaxID=1033252 RepID=A0AAD7HJM3_9AGAR|nr:hypothetical protein B0H16DRAFT_367290 [Mycena metata]
MSKLVLACSAPSDRAIGRNLHPTSILSMIPPDVHARGFIGKTREGRKEGSGIIEHALCHSWPALPQPGCGETFSLSPFCSLGSWVYKTSGAQEGLHSPRLHPCLRFGALGSTPGVAASATSSLLGVGIRRNNIVFVEMSTVTVQYGLRVTGCTWGYTAHPYRLQQNLLTVRYFTQLPIDLRRA